VQNAPTRVRGFETSSHRVEVNARGFLRSPLERAYGSLEKKKRGERNPFRRRCREDHGQGDERVSAIGGAITAARQRCEPPTRATRAIRTRANSVAPRATTFRHSRPFLSALSADVCTPHSTISRCFDALDIRDRYPTRDLRPKRS